jgi:hypothetical protein
MTNLFVNIRLILLKKWDQFMLSAPISAISDREGVLATKKHKSLKKGIPF